MADYWPNGKPQCDICGQVWSWHSGIRCRTERLKIEKDVQNVQEFERLRRTLASRHAK